VAQTSDLVRASCARRLEVQFNHLQSATEVTHQWRNHVANKLGWLPPTGYHRVLLYLYTRHQEGMDYILVSDVARMCGIRIDSVRSMTRRMENDLLVRFHSINNQPHVYLTDKGRYVTELSL